MAQPEFRNPVFVEDNTAEEIHSRMMANLPADIDDMPGGFPYDFTMPAALEKAEFINFHLVRAIMIGFPQYAWDDWLDLHGQQVHLLRHEEQRATGYVTVGGKTGTLIPAGTIFCVPSVDNAPAIEYSTDEDGIIGDEEKILLAVTAVVSGIGSNVPPNSITIMKSPNKNVMSVNNENQVTGGTERESNDNFYDRIAAEYANSMTYLGNDSDYVRWAKEAGAGDCIVISAADGPGTVKLVLVDENGQPAGDTLLNAVYRHIVSPDDRSQRLLPTACAKLSCVAATMTMISYTCTGLVYDDTTSIKQIVEDFREAVKAVYDQAKNEGVLRYNDIRPLLSTIPGVEDFDTFLINGKMENIGLAKTEYPETGTLNFS